MPQLALPEFVARWKASTLAERSACQQHIIDICDLLGQPRPAEVDQTGENYTFDSARNPCTQICRPYGTPPERNPLFPGTHVLIS